MPRPAPDRPGLQPERTELSWERTAAAFLANGILILVRPHEPLTVPRVGIAIAAIATAGTVAWFGGRRSRRVQDQRTLRVRNRWLTAIVGGFSVTVFLYLLTAGAPRA
ncbi:hypothetical protein GCM10009676_39550 [Prauserella halophila]|uniref:DUF202 domain-containing protein n=1 Tax=Prauserella halophila TaxID=185641 RepID=A0ABN1WGK1_9PSEU|nr:DUF202 domain-containing protein [Prauserella halophila]MCP2238220.1 Uncharacterized membrane protein YidH, DUF202 family [Prauserella halophila]